MPLLLHVWMTERFLMPLMDIRPKQANAHQRGPGYEVQLSYRGTKRHGSDLDGFRPLIQCGICWVD